MVGPAAGSVGAGEVLARADLVAEVDVRWKVDLGAEALLVDGFLLLAVAAAVDLLACRAVGR